MDLAGLPGSELIEKGLADLEQGVTSVEALLVAIGRPRLSRLGLPIPPHPHREPELYRYPALDPKAFRRAVERVTGAFDREPPAAPG